MAYAAASINAVGPGPLEHALTLTRLKPHPTMTWCAEEAPGKFGLLGKDATITLLAVL